MNKSKDESGSQANEVDAYLANVPEEVRASLEKLRKTIRSAAPNASEVISYKIPMYKQGGRPLVSFAAFPKHCSFFVQSPEVMRAHAADLKGYEVTKGGIHFQPDKPLPAALVKKLVKARIEENEALSKRRASRR